MVCKGTKKKQTKEEIVCFFIFFKSHDTAKMHAKHDE